MQACRGGEDGVHTGTDQIRQPVCTLPLAAGRVEMWGGGPDRPPQWCISLNSRCYRQCARFLELVTTNHTEGLKQQAFILSRCRGVGVGGDTLRPQALGVVRSRLFQLPGRRVRLSPIPHRSHLCLLLCESVRTQVIVFRMHLQNPGSASPLRPLITSCIIQGNILFIYSYILVIKMSGSKDGEGN